MEAARVLESYDDHAAPVFDPVPPPNLRAVEALGEQALHDAGLTRAQLRRCRHAEGLSDLMGRRVDLQGVSLVADHFAEYTRWAV